MSRVEIDRERCARDGLCVLECPLSLLETDIEGYPVPGPRLEAACIGCGHCLAVCPRGCLCLGGVAQESLAVATPVPDVSPGALVGFMQSRRSVRHFAARPVPRETLIACFEAARYAPSALNGQPAEFLVIEDKACIAALAAGCADLLRATGRSPDFLRAYDAGEDSILRHAPCLVLVHAPAEAPIPPATDCVIALAHLELAAHFHGLGACWAGILRYVASVHPPVRDLLALPDGHVMYGGLMLGYPRFSLRHLPPRKPLRVTWRCAQGRFSP
ncbi:nitroreductase family protein [Solidesulfovibrio alcoholivorans]|uniref:nitroreductase family protein n=1 Tax=Solidesulfovibrio alcoholivorans TaxID=81406 RepID=UPI000497A8A6|nr:nitroreductase family protein [Solidesulfovibrio alcoholivorans]